MDELIKIFKALSDKNRVRILKMLESRPLCVCEITETLGLSTSTVSNHCSILKSAGFLSDRKDGKWVEYDLKRDSKDSLVRQILAVLPDMLNDDESITADRETVQKVDRNLLCGV